MVVSGQGEVLQRNDYYAFGLAIDAVNRGENKYLFLNRELQPETGYYDLIHRQYDPAKARFDAIDPLAEKYFPISQYVYVANNPIKYIDPDGRSIWTKIGKAVFKVGKVVAKEGISSLKKGATYADAVSDIVDNGRTVLDSKASTFDRVVAGASLLSEALPVSIGDVKDVYKGGKKLLGVADDVSDANNTAKKGKRAFSTKDRTEGYEKSKDADGTARCEYCGTEMDPQKGKPNSYEADHRDPYAKGGESTQDNLAPACRDCNRSKGKKELDTEWIPLKKRNQND